MSCVLSTVLSSLRSTQRQNLVLLRPHHHFSVLTTPRPRVHLPFDGPARYQLPVSSAFFHSTRRSEASPLIGLFASVFKVDLVLVFEICPTLTICAVCAVVDFNCPRGRSYIGPHSADLCPSDITQESWFSDMGSSWEDSPWAAYYT